MRLKGNDKFFEEMNTKDMNECVHSKVVNWRDNLLLQKINWKRLYLYFNVPYFSSLIAELILRWLMDSLVDSWHLLCQKSSWISIMQSLVYLCILKTSFQNQTTIILIVLDH